MDSEFKKNISDLIFGEDYSSLNIATFQSLGGTGGFENWFRFSKINFSRK